MTLGAAAVGLAGGAAGASRFLARRPLGTSGLDVPLLGVGTATAGRELDRDEAMALFHAALDAGAGLFDTAPAEMGYGRAAEFLAPVLRERRGEAFVIAKVFTHDGARALRLLRDQLRALEIERADLALIHSVGDARIDPATLLGARGALAALRQARADGLARAIGFSAHDRPGKLGTLVRAAEGLNAVLVPVNPVDRFMYGFETTAGLEATGRGVGLLGFKIFGGAGGLPADRAGAHLRYAWGVPGLAAAIVGFRNRAELAGALGWVDQAAPLSGAARAALLAEGRRRATVQGPCYGPAGWSPDHDTDRA